MSEEAEIILQDDREHYTTGNVVVGTASVILPQEVSMQGLVVSFHGIGKAQWVEEPGTPYYCDGMEYTHQVECHKEVFNHSDKGMLILVWVAR